VHVAVDVGPREGVKVSDRFDARLLPASLNAKTAHV